MSLLSREQILKAEDRASEVIEVPEWGGSVKIQMLSGGQREDYDRSMITAEGEINQSDFKTKLVSLSIVDEDNKAMFSLKDVKALRAKSARALDRVFLAADKLSRVSMAALEESEKN